jgi:hypothetical protein
MRIRRTGIVLLTVAALLLSGGGAAFCIPASGGVMKCCKPSRPCTAGMKAADCCRFVPSSAGRTPAAVEAPLPQKFSREDLAAAVPSGSYRGSSPSEEISPHASPPLLLCRDLSVPLYILNTSLLR